MQKRLGAVILSLVTIATALSYAQADQAKQKAMEECFRKHAQLMSKPALQQLQPCWQAHGHLM